MAANDIPALSTSNTFGHLLVATNALIKQANLLNSGTYVKEGGDLKVIDGAISLEKTSGVTLTVTSDATFGGQISSKTIVNSGDLTVQGQTALFSNTTGTVTVRNNLVSSNIFANNITSNVQVSAQNVNVSGYLLATGSNLGGAPTISSFSEKAAVNVANKMFVSNSGNVEIQGTLLLSKTSGTNLNVRSNALFAGEVTLRSGLPTVNISSSANLAILQFQTNTGTTDNNIWHLKTVDSSGKLRLQAISDTLAGGGSILDINRNAQQITGINLSTSSSNDSFRITQTGSGNAFVVEDEANPDGSPFIIDAGGNVGIGTTATGFAKLASRRDSSRTEVEYGIYSTLRTSSTGGSNNKFAIQGDVGTSAGYSGTHFLTAISGVASHETTGTISSLRGVSSYLQSVGSGTVTNAYQFLSQEGGLGAGGSNTITNLFGYYASDMSSGTNNYAFFSNLSAASNKWGFYGSGTANNFFNGSLGIGTSSNLDLTKVNILKTASDTTSSEYGAQFTLNATNASGSANKVAIAPVVYTTGSYAGTGTLIAAGTTVEHKTNSIVPEVRGYQSYISVIGSGSITSAYNFRVFTPNLGAQTVGNTVGSVYGFSVDDLTTGNTAYAFYHATTFGNNRWGFYGSGTANNYFAGSIGIGTTGSLDSFKLNVAGNTRTSNLSVTDSATVTNSLTVAGVNVAPTLTASYAQANTARDQANTAYAQANAAYAQANTARDQANTATPAYNQANTARDQANTGFTQANTARDQANTAYTQANAASTQANTARDQANNAFTTANVAINRTQVFANSGATQSNVSLNFVNTANILVTVSPGSSGNANVSFNLPPTLPSLSVTSLSATSLTVTNPILAPSESDSASYRLRANQTTRGDGTFGVSQGTANGNAEIKFVSSTGNWQLTSNNITGLYYNILSSQNVSDSVTTTSSSNAASLTAVKTAYDQAIIAYAQANTSANATRVTANSGATQSNVSVNFVNTSTVTVSVTSGGTGIANVAFTSAAGGITQLNTGIGLTGGPINTTGTVSANIASTTVQGVTKLIDAVNSNDTANAATGAAVKTAYDQGTSAYVTANTSANTTAVYANASLILSKAPINFNNTSSVRVTATPSGVNYTNVAFTVIGGAGSGLDADTLDGLNSSSFVRSDATTTGNISLTEVAPFIRLQSNDVDVFFGQELGSILFATNDASVGGSGDKVKITAEAEGVASGGALNLFTAADGASSTIAVSIRGNNDFRLYSSGSANFHSIRSQASSNSSVTIPNGDVVLKTGTAANITEVSTAYAQANVGYTQANTARDQANTSYTQANTARDQANTSYAQANTARDQANNAFTTANVAINRTQVTANSTSTQSNVSLNFVNTATVTVSVGTGGTGIANIAFNTSSAGTVQNINTGLGLTGGPISVTGTVSANIASTTVQGVTKLIDSVTSNDTANAATGAAVKSAFDQATLAYSAANTGLNRTQVSANSAAVQSNVGINFNNTSTTTVSVGAGTSGNANVSFTVTPTFTSQITTTSSIYSAGGLDVGTQTSNATLSLSTLILRSNTANITNAYVELIAAGGTGPGISYLELGSNSANYIDFKTPYTDDYDYRIFGDKTSGLYLYAGSSTASPNVLSIVSGNVNIDSGTLFVDYLSDEVGIGTTNPTTKLDVVGSANVSGSLNVSVDIKSSGDIFGLDRVTIGSASRITGIAGITAVSGVTMASNSAVVGEMALAHYSTVIDDSSIIKFVKSSSTTIGAKSGIASGETLGQISFGGFGGAGTVARKAAVIRGISDGSPTDSSMPGELIFSTTPSGTIIPVDRMVISNTGFVGIGTSTPNATLDVVGTAIITNSVSGETALRITKAAGTGNAFVVEDQTNPDSTPFIIDDSGFVVVGHSETLLGTGSIPVHQLHGTGAFSQRSRYGAFHWSASPGQSPSIELNRANNSTGTVNVHGAVYPDDLLGSIRASGSNGTQFILATKIDSEADGIATTGTPGRLVFLTNPGTGTTTAERMRITSTGNVGIGNTAPDHKLSVSGSTFVSGAAIFTGTVVDRPVTSISASTSYAENAAGKTIVVNSASPVTLTFNSAAYAGFTVDVIRKGAGNVTIANTSTIAKLNVASVQPVSNITSQYATVRVTYTATNEFILTGSIQP